MSDSMRLPDDLREHDWAERVLMRVSKAMAVSGGLLFLALIAMSLVSIVGRKLGFGSVNGDIELMQAGTAVAVAAFLPYCTLKGEHIKVEFFTERMRSGMKRRIDGLAELVLGLACAALVWRTALAALDLRETQESTPLVGLPLWIAVALLLPSLGLVCLCAWYRVYAYWRTPNHPAGETLA